MGRSDTEGTTASSNGSCPDSPLSFATLGVATRPLPPDIKEVWIKLLTRLLLNRLTLKNLAAWSKFVPGQPLLHGKTADSLPPAHGAVAETHIWS